MDNINNTNNNTNNVNNDILISIFNASYMALIYGIISEIGFIMIHDKLIKLNFKTYYHDHYVPLILSISDYEEVYVYMTLIYLYDLYELEIRAMCVIFKTISNIFKSEKYDNMEKIEKYIKVKDRLEKLIMRLKSFQKKERFNDIIYTLNDPNIEFKIKDHVIIDHWNTHNRNDYIDRLFNFCDLFSNLQLLFFGVDMKTYHEIYSMTDIELEHYYRNVLDKTYVSLQKLIITADICIDIELAYNNMLYYLCSNAKLDKSVLELVRHNIIIIND